MVCTMRNLRLVCSSLWNHPLLIPSYCALLSIVILITQIIFSSGPVRRFRGVVTPEATRGESDVAAGTTRTGFVSAVKDHVKKSGGSIIFLFQVSRLVVVFTLLSLAIFSFVQEEGREHVSPSSVVNSLGTRRGKKHKVKYHGSLTKREWLDLMLCLTYVRHRCVFELTLSQSHQLDAAICGLLGVSRCDRPESARFGYFFPSILTLAWHLLHLCLPQHLATPYFYLVPCGCRRRRLTVGQNQPSGFRSRRDPCHGPASLYTH